MCGHAFELSRESFNKLKQPTPDELLKKCVEKAILLLPANPKVTDIINGLMRELKSNGQTCPLCNATLPQAVLIEQLKKSEIF